jgi:TRAP-type C4-dicarboxylate transport system permease small subunit
MNKHGNNAKSRLEQALVVIRRAEDSILVLLLTLMIGLSAVQIVLRNLFEAGIIWGDVLVRVLVLWIGLLGAMIATRQDKHISIDLVARYLPEGFKGPVKAIVELLAAVICAVAAHYSFNFVRNEFYDGGLAFGQVPVWVCEAIIPVAFAVIALRFFIMSLVKFSAFKRSAQ